MARFDSHSSFPVYPPSGLFATLHAVLRVTKSTIMIGVVSLLFRWDKANYPSGLQLSALKLALPLESDPSTKAEHRYLLIVNRKLTLRTWDSSRAFLRTL